METFTGIYLCHGHKAQYCSKNPKCPNCNARKHPQGATCPAETGQRPFFCGACKGQHSAKDTKRCPVARDQWQLAKQLHNDRPTFFPERSPIVLSPTAPTTASAQAPAPEQIVQRP